VRTGCGDSPLSILDLGCGKGGDLKKFVNCGVTQFCGVDISAGVLEELLRRVGSIVSEAQRAKHGLLGQVGFPLREVSIVQADCWQEDLPQLLDTRARHGTARLAEVGKTWFHCVSSQMACHYAFESEASAEAMLRNASQRLCEGGVFVITVPDATSIVAAQRSALRQREELQLGNELFQIEFDSTDWEKVESSWEAWQTYDSPAAGSNVFGIMYRFTLLDAVERCWEPLLHFETLRTLAQRCGLTLHLGPKPLADIVAEAHGDGDLGRLRRIYFHSGGMNLDQHSREREALRFYLVAAFRKTASGSCSMTCKRLADHLVELQQSEESKPRLPSSLEDIVRAPR